MSAATKRYRSGNQLELVRGGKAYFDALQSLIFGARQCLHVQLYILDPDSTGRQFVGWLREVAGRGVRIYLVADAFGSRELDLEELSREIGPNLTARKHAPLFRGMNFRLGQRLHQKVIIADQSEALLGGINVADKYRGVGEAPWLDYAVRVRGPLCRDIFSYCLERWPFGVCRRMPVPAAPKTSGEQRARLIRNNLKKGRIEITLAYVNALQRARREVLILSSYFIPGPRMLNALVAARRRGVRIVLIVPGISDVPFIQKATEYLYKWLLQLGVEIYEWQESVLHGKILVTDGDWATVGSYNPNELSDYFSHELNIEARDGTFVHAVHMELNNHILPLCTPMDIEAVRGRFIWFRRLLQALSYYLLWLACRIAIPDKRWLHE